MTDLSEALGTLVGTAVKDNPKITEIKERFRRGEMSEEIAFQEMLEEIGKNPDVLAAIEQMRPLGEKTRLPRINPLIEAALIERAQFDGDMPELRFGPLGKAKPAVPVVLQGSNPVAGGLMLKAASEEMSRQISTHEAKRQATVQHYLEAAVPQMQMAGDTLTISTPELTDLVRGTAETDHPDYRRGQLPALMRVEPPTTAALALLTPQEAREAAWTLLSTTQGRRSAQPVIVRLLTEDLQKRGYKITFRDPTKAQNHLALHEWKVRMSGPGSTQAAFSFIDMAAKVLSAGLRSKLAEGVKEILVEVETIDRVADRVVGWRAVAFDPKDAHPAKAIEAMQQAANLVFRKGAAVTLRPAPVEGAPATMKLRTFIILGGEPFTIEMPLTPLLDHDGRRTVWKMYSQDADAVEVESFIRSTGADVQVLLEEQTPDMTLERLATTGQPGPK